MQWNRTDSKLTTQLTFRNFREAFAFMTEVAMVAEKMNHHPLWTNVWNSVEINLTTHDAGNTITEKDEQLARAIEQIYVKYA